MIVSSFGRVPFTPEDIEAFYPKNEEETLLFPTVNPFLTSEERTFHTITLSCWALYSSVATGDYRGRLISSLYQNYCTYQKRIVDKVKSIKAVVTLQARMRGHLVRVVSLKKAMKEGSPLVEHPIYADTQPYINKKLLSSMPRAPYGKTPVFMPDGSSRIVKQSDYSEGRLQHMESIRSFCKNSGWRHLIIPEAFIHQKMLIEERLPIIHRLEGQIAFYLIHWRELTKAVREFIELTFKCWIGDLTSNSFPYCYMRPLGASCPRYDNLSFFIDTKNKEDGVSQYKIGLVDVERFHSRDSILVRDDMLEILVVLFPHHLNLIIEMGRQYGGRISDYEVRELSSLQEAMLTYFQRVAGNHIVFLQSRGITPANVDQPFILSEEQERQIWKRIDQLWESDHPDFERRSHLRVEFMTEIFPLILKAISYEINDALQNNINSWGGKEHIVSYEQVVVCRRICKCPLFLENALIKRLNLTELSEDMMRLTYGSISFILKAFAAEELIAHYGVADTKNISLSF